MITDNFLGDFKGLTHSTVLVLGKMNTNRILKYQVPLPAIATDTVKILTSSIQFVLMKLGSQVMQSAIGQSQLKNQDEVQPQEK